MTLKMGIELTLAEKIIGFKEVVQVFKTNILATKQSVAIFV